jgi:hypothetical protein
LAIPLLLQRTDACAHDRLVGSLARRGAISLMAGEVASTLLSRMTVPLLYYLSQKE